jgi:phenylacetic acid degradation operon negative regulatory protein
MLTFLGIHVLGRAVAVSSGSVIDVLGRVGVTEEAARSTLTRMVGRGLLDRHRQGRKMYFALTPRAV